MSRSRLLFLSSMAVMVVAAVGSSTALAAFEDTTVECPQAGTGIPVLCLLSPLKEAKGTETFTSTILSGSEALLQVASLEFHIVCTVANGAGTIEQPEPLVKAPLIMKNTLTFKECEILNEGTAKLGEKCEVQNKEIKTKEIDGETLSTEPQHLEFKPETGEVFTEISIGNKTGQTCPAFIKGLIPVKGEQLCTLLTNTEDAETHVLDCLEEGELAEIRFKRDDLQTRREPHVVSQNALGPSERLAAGAGEVLRAGGWLGASAFQPSPTGRGIVVEAG